MNTKTEVLKVSEPVYGKHSEVQVIIKIPAGGYVDLKLYPTDINQALLWSGFAADYPAGVLKVQALPNYSWEVFEVFPHEAILSPQVEKIVHENVKRILPVVTKEVPMGIRVINLDSTTDHELEVVLGLIYTDKESAYRIKADRLTYRPTLRY